MSGCYPERKNAIVALLRTSQGRLQTQAIMELAHASQSYVVKIRSEWIDEQVEARKQAGISVVPTEPTDWGGLADSRPPVPAEPAVEVPNHCGGSAKETAARAAITSNPRQPGESQKVYCQRIAGLIGCSGAHVYTQLQLEECRKIGVALRAKEKREQALVVPAPKTEALGPIRDFTSWALEFSKFKMVAEHYRNFAVARGDVYAASFLGEVQHLCERAQARAECERSQ